jgi:hypothetical protein
LWRTGRNIEGGHIERQSRISFHYGKRFEVFT